MPSAPGRCQWKWIPLRTAAPSLLSWLTKSLLCTSVVNASRDFRFELKRLGLKLWVFRHFLCLVFLISPCSYCSSRRCVPRVRRGGGLLLTRQSESFEDCGYGLLDRHRIVAALLI